MQILRNLVIVAILFIVIGGFLIVAEVPSLPTWAQQLDATIGLSHSGRLARAGFAKSTAQVGMFFYDPKKDEYKWGLNGHFENLPIGAVIRVDRLIDHRIFTCINGQSILFNSLNLFDPEPEENVSEDKTTQNHTKDACNIIIPRSYSW
jgi:hypothetical protein